jgi:anti-sigma factor RsiW
MNCEWVRQNLVLYVYEELPDDARHELEQHAARCQDCARELEGWRRFRSSLAQLPAEEPSPELVAACRMQLQEALESAEQRRSWWSRLTFDPVAWLNQARFAPALAAALVMIGFGAGVGATYKLKTNPQPIADGSSAPAALSAISGVSSIVEQPGSRQVTVKYETVSPREAHGSLDDPDIQQLLLYAARNNFNAGLRMDSVNLLSQQPANEHVREALLFALRYDSNPGVRLKALDGLGASVKQDVAVRDAVLESLMADSNPGVRIEALRLLEPVRADSSVRLVLERLAAKDENRYIRSEARTLLAQLPEID